eukprot:365734-Chlamydomonas_euryale.AAC.21
MCGKVTMCGCLISWQIVYDNSYKGLDSVSISQTLHTCSAAAHAWKPCYRIVAPTSTHPPSSSNHSYGTRHELSSGFRVQGLGCSVLAQGIPPIQGCYFDCICNARVPVVQIRRQHRPHLRLPGFPRAHPCPFPLQHHPYRRWLPVGQLPGQGLRLGWCSCMAVCMGMCVCTGGSVRM